ncbi:MAG: hypothetical protein IKF68_02245 [Erysipelotrichaceae bacterium]|nr:hypothetical protein [Erysipelotrichaceae bacterium]
MKKMLIIGAAVFMVLSMLSGCFAKTYTIGKDPKLEEITSVYAGGGGMEYSSSWTWSVSSGKEGRELYRRYWDEEKSEMTEVTVKISEDDYNIILNSLEGLRYVKYNAPKNVMDGYSETVRIYWKNSPSGSYRVDMESKDMSDLLKAFRTVWDKHNTQ